MCSTSFQLCFSKITAWSNGLITFHRVYTQHSLLCVGMHTHTQTYRRTHTYTPCQSCFRPASWSCHVLSQKFPAHWARHPAWWMTACCLRRTLAKTRNPSRCSIHRLWKQKKKQQLRSHLVAFQFQILQNCGPYIWWANKVNRGFPLTPAAKESISPPLIPHAQIINPIKNSYLHIDINRYIYMSIFRSANSIVLLWTEHVASKTWIWLDTAYCFTPFRRKKQQTFDTFLNRPFKT